MSDTKQYTPTLSNGSEVLQKRMTEIEELAIEIHILHDEIRLLDKAVAAINSIN